MNFEVDMLIFDVGTFGDDRFSCLDAELVALYYESLASRLSKKALTFICRKDN